MSDALRQPDLTPSRPDEAQGTSAADAAAAGDPLAPTAADLSGVSTRSEVVSVTNNSGGVNVQGGQVGSIGYTDNRGATFTHTHIEAEQAYEVSGLPNPYLGLQSFTYDNQAGYAGRDSEIEVALKKLTALPHPQTLLFVTGASGSGKSSFALAGLVPALEKYYQEEYGQTLKFASFRPSAYPLYGLSQALSRLGLLGMGQIIESKSQFETTLKAVPDGRVNIVVIDQFEELFTQADPAQAATLLEILSDLPPFDQTHTHLIASLRVDYLPDLFPYKRLYKWVKDGIELRVMTPLELTAAIQRPVQVGYPNGQKRFEPELVERLAGDATQEAAYLPLLAVTLEELWGGGSLRLARYESLTTAIERRANSVVEYELDEEGRRTRPRSPAGQQQILDLLLELVSVSLDDDPRLDVRRRRDYTALVGDSTSRKALVQELTEARLINTGQENREGREVVTVDIIHESLIRQWGRLGQTIEANRSTLRRRRRLVQAVEDWKKNAKNKKYLLSGVGLEEARELEAAQDSELQDSSTRELVQLSKQAQSRRRSRQLQIAGGVISVLLVLLALAVMAGIFAVNQTNQANDAKNAAEAQRKIAFSRQLATQVRPLLPVLTGNEVAPRNITTAFLLSIQARRLNNQLEANNPFNEAASDANSFPTLTGHSYDVYSVAFSPDGKTLASASGDETIRLWDVTSHSPLATLAAHSDRVWSVAFSPDGKTLASASGDETIRLWDVASHSPLPTLKGHSGSVYSVAFSPDGKTLASTSGDKTIRLWDVASHSPLATLTGHSYAVYSVAFSPDGKTLASASSDETIRLWDVASRSALATLSGHSGSVYSVAFSPDGKTLASASDDGAIRLWDVASKSSIATLTGHSDYVSSVAFSPDGKTLASASQDKTIRLWDVASRSALATLSGHSNPVTSVAFSPDGKTLASASFDRTIRLWDVASHSSLATLSGHAASVRSVAFSPDGKTLASASDDNTIWLWDVASHPPLTTRIGYSSYVRSVAFSPNGKTLASASDDKTIRLWDVASKSPLPTLKGHSGSVYSVAFSPDGKTLASASGDNTIRLWDVASHSPLATLAGHSSYVNSVAFSPDGKTLASASDDKTIILWDNWYTNDWLDRACKLAGRNLTWAEWQQYAGVGEPYLQTCPSWPLPDDLPADQKASLTPAPTPSSPTITPAPTPTAKP